jgi:uncharacterized protein YoaH (UPF0181 family)
MASNELLGVYLNDHLAGSAAGVELAEKLASTNEGTPFGTAVAAVAEEIREDRETLKGLIERLAIGKSPVKQAAGWVFEKVTRLRFNQQLTGSEELTRLLETETLSLGIEGKLAMWQALKAIDGLDAELGPADFDRLIFRARRQRETLEPHRLEAAAKAFSS